MTASNALCAMIMTPVYAPKYYNSSNSGSNDVVNSEALAVSAVTVN